MLGDNSTMAVDKDFFLFLLLPFSHTYVTVNSFYELFLLFENGELKVLNNFPSLWFKFLNSDRMDGIWFRRLHPAEDEWHTDESRFTFNPSPKSHKKTLFFSKRDISCIHWADALKVHYAVLETKFEIRVLTFTMMVEYKLGNIFIFSINKKKTKLSSGENKSTV